MDVTQLISNVGFPIVAFLIMVIVLKQVFEANREDQKANNDQISHLAEAINNNTIVLTKLVEKFDKEKESEQ